MSARYGTIGRWLLALLVSSLALVLAAIGIELLMGIDARLIPSIDSSGLNLPTREVVATFNVLEIFVGCVLWCLPTSLVIGFALRAPSSKSALTGLIAALILLGAFLWIKRASIAPRVAVVAGALVLTLSFFLLLRKPHTNRRVLAANCLALALFLSPNVIAFARAPKTLPAPKKLWTRTLQSGTWEAMNTGSEYDATRHLAFGDGRLVAVYDAGFAPYEGTQPMSRYRLVSVDLENGAVLNERSFISKWGYTPFLYAVQGGLTLMTSATLGQTGSSSAANGDQPTIPRQGGSSVSRPDPEANKQTAAHNVVLNTKTLIATAAPADLKPNDETGIAPLLKTPELNNCSGHTAYVTNRLIFASCFVKVVILDLNGQLVKQIEPGGNPSFAGVSQDGRRLAFAESESRGDPTTVLFEHFIIFDTESAQPVAMIKMRHMPERQSWSAFSRDGHLFAAGSPTELSLYHIP